MACLDKSFSIGIVDTSYIFFGEDTSEGPIVNCILWASLKLRDHET